MQTDLIKWKDFEIGSLFNIIKGTRLTNKDAIDGEIRFIGASAMNNGITKYVANNEHLHPGNVLTVNYNGSVGKTYYQDELFWASDDVNVLYPNFEMNKYVGLFIATIIEKVGKNYAFVEKWKLEDMKADTIKLPATSSGTPDFDYMESYMRSIEDKARKKLESLLKIVC